MRAILVLLVLALAGCASDHAESFLGQDVRQVMIEDGPPINAFDMPDGRRAFQFRWGGGALPGFSQTGGTVNQSYFTASTLSYAPIQTPGCLMTYIARRQGPSWIIEEVHWQGGLVC